MYSMIKDFVHTTDKDSMMHVHVRVDFGTPYTLAARDTDNSPLLTSSIAATIALSLHCFRFCLTAIVIAAGADLDLGLPLFFQRDIILEFVTWADI